MKLSEIQQIQTDRKNGVIVCSATFDRLLMHALAVTKDGYKFVPEVPTPEMIKHGRKVKLFHSDGGKSDVGVVIACDVYREMIGAAE